jgi:hypothetical protein
MIAEKMSSRKNGDRPQEEIVPKILMGEARAIESGGYHGLIAAAYDDPVFLAALNVPEDLLLRSGAEILSEGRNRVLRLALPLSSGAVADIIVKEFSSRGVIKLKSLVLPPKAERAWRGAAALAWRGLGTALPVAWFARRKRGAVERSFFLSERIAGAAEVRGLFRDLPAEELEPLLGALAGFLSVLHAQGILHRDLSDGNVLVRRSDPGRFEFFLLDTNRIRVRRRLGDLSRAKNLIRLGVPAAYREDFLARYFGGRAPAHLRLWYKINKSVFTNYMALKRRLRLRRLARALRIQ